MGSKSKQERCPTCDAPRPRKKIKGRDHADPLWPKKGGKKATEKQRKRRQRLAARMTAGSGILISVLVGLHKAGLL